MDTVVDARVAPTLERPTTKHSENNMYEIIKWPEELAPSRSPIHFTNELEVTASPETIWSLLVDPKA
jgi:uncharacterized protein YndB with AHSA1/START domain